jgi:hypothetical protein
LDLISICLFVGQPLNGQTFSAFITTGATCPSSVRQQDCVYIPNQEINNDYCNMNYPPPPVPSSCTLQVKCLKQGTSDNGIKAKSNQLSKYYNSIQQH